MIAYAFANLPVLIAFLFVALFIGRWAVGARATEVGHAPRELRRLNPKLLRRMA